MAGDRPDVPAVPEDLLNDIKSAYNALIQALEAANLPRPPSWT